MCGPAGHCDDAGAPLFVDMLFLSMIKDYPSPGAETAWLIKDTTAHRTLPPEAQVNVPVLSNLIL